MATIKEAIKAVLPHASKDNTLPILCAVKITGDEVWATDRYTLARGVYVLPKAGDEEAPTYPDGFVIDAKDAAELVKHKSEVLAIALHTAGPTTDHNVKFHMQDGSMVVCRLIEGDYPNIGRLIPDGDPKEIGVIGLSSANLDKFAAKHFPKHAHSRFGGRASVALKFEFYGETKPAKVTIANAPWYTGLIVPIRLNE